MGLKYCFYTKENSAQSALGVCHTGRKVKQRTPKKRVVNTAHSYTDQPWWIILSLFSITVALFLLLLCVNFFGRYDVL